MKSVPAIDRLHVPAEAVEVLAAAAGSDDAKKQRSYKMLGYSGGAFSRWYGNVVIDVAGMKLEPVLPAFMEHDRDRRVGFGKGKVKDGQLHVEGTLLRNAHSASLLEDADAGFPFQASIGVAFEKVLALAEGESKEVNGRTFDGPGYVVTRSRVFECSPVALGADRNTETEMFGAPKDGPMIEVEQLQKEIPVDANEKKKIEDAAAAEALKADKARAKTITELCGKDHADLALSAITEGLSVQDVKDQIAERQKKQIDELKAAKAKLEAEKANPAVPFGGASREALKAAETPAEDALAGYTPSELNELKLEDAKELLADEWKNAPKDVKRAFRNSADDYAALRKAESRGLVKILWDDTKAKTK